jgi:segregation and condensation protein B
MKGSPVVKSNESPISATNDPASLGAVLEAILFVAGSAVPFSALAEATGASSEQIVTALAHVRDSVAQRGIRLQVVRDSAQLVSAPEYAYWIERFLGLDLSGKLSTAALETLAIIAYRQPITRPEIEAIRGVNSAGTLRTLLQRELVEEVGRLETVGYPYQYGTTTNFLQYFGLTSLDELPQLTPEEMAKILNVALPE